jgi:hypothetical protein
MQITVESREYRAGEWDAWVDVDGERIFLPGFANTRALALAALAAKWGKLDAEVRAEIERVKEEEL